MNISEKNIQQAIIELLTRKKIFHWRQNSGAVKSIYENRNGEKKERFFRFIKFGYPFDHPIAASDIAGLHQGRFFAIEVKTPKGILDEKQKNYLDCVNENGGIGIVARSIDDVIALFNNWDNFELNTKPSFPFFKN